MRNSDPDAAVYWLARMLEAGEDPLYVARRLVRFASEDVGNADLHALSVAVAAKDAVHFIGLPEGNTALAQAAIYLATAPKSNAIYTAYAQAAEDAHRDVAEPVPLHLRNAPTDLMKTLGYGKGYRYAHTEPDGVAPMSCLPPALQGRTYYRPTERGFETGDRGSVGAVGTDQEEEEKQDRGLSYLPTFLRTASQPTINTATPAPKRRGLGPSGPAVKRATTSSHMPSS